jgi:hypothetical protein
MLGCWWSFLVDVRDPGGAMLAPPGPPWTPLVVSAWVDNPPGSFSRVSVSEPSNYEKVDR